MKGFAVIALMLAVVVVLSGCVSAPENLGGAPFQDRLDFYYRWQRNGKSLFIASAMSIAAAWAYGTYFATGRGYNPTAHNAFGLYSSYAFSAAYIGVGAYSVYLWFKYDNLYHHALREKIITVSGE